MRQAVQFVLFCLRKACLLAFQTQLLHAIEAVPPQVSLLMRIHSMNHQIADGTYSCEAKRREGKIAGIGQQTTHDSGSSTRHHPSESSISHPTLQVMMGSVENHTTDAKWHCHRRHIHLNRLSLQNREGISQNSSCSAYALTYASNRYLLPTVTILNYDETHLQKSPLPLHFLPICVILYFQSFTCSGTIFSALDSSGTTSLLNLSSSILPNQCGF